MAALRKNSKHIPYPHQEHPLNSTQHSMPMNTLLKWTLSLAFVAVLISAIAMFVRSGCNFPVFGEKVKTVVSDSTEMKGSQKANNPVEFYSHTIARIDEELSKIAAKTEDLGASRVRAERLTAEAESRLSLNQNVLAKMVSALKAAREKGSWPVSVDNRSYTEQEAEQTIVSLAKDRDRLKKTIATNQAYINKIGGILAAAKNMRDQLSEKKADLEAAKSSAELSVTPLSDVRMPEDLQKLLDLAAGTTESLDSIPSNEQLYAAESAQKLSLDDQALLDSVLAE